MSVDLISYERLQKELKPFGAGLVAVSKKKTIQEIRELYDAGHRDFGENYVQELVEKQQALPGDIRWHFIGHLQSNKVKSVAPFIHLVHSVDSFSLLKEINKQAQKNNRVIDCLLQIFIAEEETKFGLSFDEAEELLHSAEFLTMKNIHLKGVMGMATLTEDAGQIRKEFKSLSMFFNAIKNKNLPGVSFQFLSMGMTSDYGVALEEGSNQVRIGSALFGDR